MSEERVAVVLARHRAVPPPGVPAAAFSDAALADCYEVLADLVGVVAGVAGGDPTTVAALLWPDSVAVPDGSPYAVVGSLPSGSATAVLVPADVPDLPGLVVAKLFRALLRSDLAVAPDRNDPHRAAALGVRVPWPEWIPVGLDLDRIDLAQLRSVAPGRPAIAVGPDWHRLTEPGSVSRLDPGLEGWDSVRALLTGAV